MSQLVRNLATAAVYGSEEGSRLRGRFGTMCITHSSAAVKNVECKQWPLCHFPRKSEGVRK